MTQNPLGGTCLRHQGVEYLSFGRSPRREREITEREQLPRGPRYFIGSRIAGSRGTSTRSVRFWLTGRRSREENLARVRQVCFRPPTSPLKMTSYIAKKAGRKMFANQAAGMEPQDPHYEVNTLGCGPGAGEESGEDSLPSRRTDLAGGSGGACVPSSTLAFFKGRQREEPAGDTFRTLY